MLRIAALAALLATQAAADPAPISAVVAEINGREVVLDGQIGTAPMGDGYRLRTEEGDFFSLELAVDRETLAAIRDCKLEMFHVDDADCKVSVKSEIAVRGNRIDLIAFEIKPL